ncbi:nitrilase-related carbon-nitrogen hydrolase [Halioxenophilus aromaticivorans]|uniref:CN hydrolase domain-containing protein n=1 Tax=Halioxenophilus aromaticivorans TaxID=1306992 RepID=A0AAV3U7C2_9ALTE
MKKINLAVTQMSCGWDRGVNIENAVKLVHEAAAQGAQIVLLRELFETPYFC